MLVQAQKEVQECAREHLLPDGRYAVWIVVNARGRGRVELRDAPAAVSASGRRCVMRAYSKQIYPKAIEATVAWSASSPPRATYSIAFPLELRVNGYGFATDGDPLSSGMLDAEPLRPRAAWVP